MENPCVFSRGLDLQGGKMDRHLFRTISLLVCILLFIFCPAFGEIPNSGISYQGSALNDSPLLHRLQSLIISVDTQAGKRAEDLTGLSLDRSRLHLHLVDVPEGMTVFHVSMSTSGYDTVSVSVRAQVWLRSAAKDSLAAQQTLTHEYVHAILRQNMQAEDYNLLPEWFQEGLAVYIAGQHKDKLWTSLARKWQNPHSLHESLADRSAASAYLAGSWWFQALDQHFGAGKTKELLSALLIEQNLNDAISAIGCSVDDVWEIAERNAEEEVQVTAGDVGALLHECLEVRSDDPNRCRKCLGNLIAKYPETYAAEYALFFAAKLSYQQQYLKDARDFLSQLSRCRRDYGFGDYTLFLRLLIEFDSGRNAEAHQLCGEYFALWPDGNYWGRVQTICRRLR